MVMASVVTSFQEMSHTWIGKGKSEESVERGIEQNQKLTDIHEIMWGILHTIDPKV